MINKISNIYIKRVSVTVLWSVLDPEMKEKTQYCCCLSSLTPANIPVKA